jgi:hypothetical protein
VYEYRFYGWRDCVVRRVVNGGVGRKQYNKYLNHLNQGTYTQTNINGFSSHESAEVSDRQQTDEAAYVYLYCSLTSIHLSYFANEISKSSCAIF